MEKFLFKKPRLEGKQEDVPQPLSPKPSTSTSSHCESQGNISSPPSQVIVPKAPSGRKFQKSWQSTFKWISYDSTIDRVFCKTCKEADGKSLLSFSTKKEDVFTTVGFCNWKKALEKFRVHENSQTHKEGLTKLASLSTESIASKLNDQVKTEMMKARTCLMAIFTSLRFLCRQGLAIRGHEEINSNFRQLLELRKHDIPELNDWMGRTGYTYKFFSHDILNEIIDVLSESVMQVVLQQIKNCDYYSIMVDETCDISVHEQVTFCIRTVNTNFEVIEDFIGLYETSNTEAKTLFEIVKDILVRLDLSTENLRGQCYDGASQMSGKFTGLQKLIKDLQPRATYIHCTAHSLNLAVEDSLRLLPNMRDIMNLAKDLINTVRESPKRLNIFQSVQVESGNSSTSLRPLCPTRWTMRASSIKQIIVNYESLIEFFQKFSNENSTDAASKCAGYFEKMEQFKTYFFMTLYCYVMIPVEEVNTKIQSSHIGATEVEMMLNNMSTILEKRRLGFEEFWEESLLKKPDMVHEPTLPRQQRVPKKLDTPKGAEQHTYFTPKEYFLQIFNETVDAVSNCVKERFLNTGLQQLILVEKECVSAVADATVKLENSKAFFKNDIDTDRLSLHLSMLGDIASQKKVPITSVYEIRKFLQSDGSLCDLLAEATKCIKLLRTVPVTTATAERSFSALRRLKSYLRSTMQQRRLNSIAVLNTHQNILDNLDLRPLLNDFVKRNSVRRTIFAIY